MQPDTQRITDAVDALEPYMLQALACTATINAKHFRHAGGPVTCHGPEARNIRDIDEAVSLASMKRVTVAMAQLMVDWCGVEPATH
ncbi:hypothetical protein [Bordetella ansorpii]|nr:hypothetical protein [Bordetella ansorpii]